MQWPPNDSPVWSLLRLIVLASVCPVLMTVMYKNGFDPKVDIPTLIGLLLTVAGFDQFKRSITKSDDK